MIHGLSPSASLEAPVAFVLRLIDKILVTTGREIQMCETIGREVSVPRISATLFRVAEGVFGLLFFSHPLSFTIKKKAGRGVGQACAKIFRVFFPFAFHQIFR